MDSKIFIYIRPFKALQHIRCLSVLILSLFVLCIPVLSQNNEKETIYIKNADYMKYFKETKITRLEGHVEIAYRDVTLMADRAELDEKRKVVVARGRVVFSDPKNEITGRYIFYNYDAEYFEMLSPTGTATSPKVKGKVYYTGKIASGTRQKIKIRNGVITTCAPYCRREYHVTAKDITIYPGNKIIARKAAFFIGNRRTLYFPVYVISLKEEQVEHVEFGYNEHDGFYLIVKYPFMSKENIDGRLLFDHRTLRGTELGNEYKYTSKRLGGKGNLNFSNRSDKKTGRSENKFRLQQNYDMFDTKGYFKYDRDSSTYSGKSTTNINKIELTAAKSIKNSTHNISLKHEFQHVPNEIMKTFLTYNQTLRYKKYTSTTIWNYTEVLRGSGLGKNKNLMSRFTLTRNRPVYNTTLKMIKSFDLDGADDFESVKFTQPEVTFNFNIPILKRKYKVINYLPLTALSYAYGKYTNGTRHSITLPRQHVSTKKINTTLSKSFKFGKRTTFTPSHNFTQFFYSTTDAMYTIRNTMLLNYNFTKTNRLSLAYNDVRDSGGTPVSKKHDFEVSTVRAGFHVAKPKTSFQANTTYNYKTFKYSPLNISYRRYTSQNSQFNLGTTYDLENDKFGNTSTGMTISRKNTRMNITALWNTEELELTQSKITFDITRKNGWHFEVSTQYNGVSRVKKPFLQQVNATKTNCCTEIQMSYKTDLSEFIFQYVILAFPKQRLGFTRGDKGLEFQQEIFEGTKPGEQQ